MPTCQQKLGRRPVGLFQHPAKERLRDYVRMEQTSGHWPVRSFYTFGDPFLGCCEWRGRESPVFTNHALDGPQLFPPADLALRLDV